MLEKEKNWLSAVSTRYAKEPITQSLMNLLSIAELLKTACISVEELRVAKDEENEALEIAEEAVQVKKAFNAVGQIVRDQAAGMNEIVKSTETIRVEIGDGIDELEQALQLQKEARQKKCLIFFLALLIAAAIVTPIVLHFIK